jgi:hypothetical protein
MDGWRDMEENTTQQQPEYDDLYSLLNVAREESLAILFGVTLAGLRNSRAKGLGPKFIRVGREVYYPVGALREWFESHTIDPTTTAPTLADSSPRPRRAARAPKAQ